MSRTEGVNIIAGHKKVFRRFISIAILIMQLAVMSLTVGTAENIMGLEAYAHLDFPIGANEGAESGSKQALPAESNNAGDAAERGNDGNEDAYNETISADNDTKADGEAAESDGSASGGAKGGTIRTDDESENDGGQSDQENGQETLIPAEKPDTEHAQDQKSELKDLMPVVKGSSGNRYVALTFDDGLDKKRVELTLNILSEYQIKTTFFVIGKAIVNNPELWKRAVQEGHQICNHTQNHANLSELADEDVLKELADWEKSVEKVLGTAYIEQMKKEFPYVRLPGGGGNKDTRILKLVREAGYIPVGWTIETFSSIIKNHDYKNEPIEPIADEIASYITKKTTAGAIVLLHFNSFDTSALKDIIDGLSAKELKCVKVSEIL